MQLMALLQCAHAHALIVLHLLVTQQYKNAALLPCQYFVTMAIYALVAAIAISAAKIRLFLSVLAK
jgi:hypothetical protein